jgi:hypothetical protein
MNRRVSFSNPSFKELLQRGRVVEVTRVGAMCGLEEFEYCARERCQFWDKENYRCEQFVWVSIFFDGRYHTAIVPISKVKEEEKIAKFIR